MYLEALFSRLHSAYTHTEQACENTVCLSPFILPPNTHTHIVTHTALYRKGQILSVCKAEGGSLVGNTAYYISKQFYKMVARTNLSTSRDSRQTVAYSIRCAHRTWRCSYHLLEIAVKTSKLISIEDGMGAKLTTNGDTCDVLKSSPKVLFFVKNVLQGYAVGMFANLVTSRGHGIVPCFSAQVAVGNRQKW